MIGQTISHYKILDKLGEGGMGAVYKAYDTKLHRDVALKFLSSTQFVSDTDRAKLLQEARAAAAISHPNICSIIDIQNSGDEEFLVMEFIEGQSLRARIDAGPLDVEGTMKLIIQVAEGLKAAHKRGIIHRDIKPENIIITQEGIAKIADFGLAGTAERLRESASGNISGTIAYMSPEQVQGEPVDYSTDIWSLGIVLYEMVTGKPPFAGEYQEAMMYAIVHEKHAPISRFLGDAPAGFEKVIDRCLEKSPMVRFPDMDTLIEELRRIEHGLKHPRESEPKSIAVLPFTDISPKKDNQYFSDGLTEEIITRLSKLKGVRVVSRTSVMQYERSEKTTKQIATDLGAQYVLEGSVRKQGSDLRITTQLVDATKDTYLWTEQYRGTMSDIFDIQETVGSKIAKALKVRITPGEKKTLKRRSTQNTEAYQLYLKGRFFWNKRNKEGLLTAIKYFEEAIEKDAGYALAWAGISDSYNLLSEYVGIARKETFSKAKAAVDMALKLDGQLSEARTSLALLIMLYQWDWANAEKEFKLSIYLNPEYATAHHWYATWLQFMGRMEEAIEEITLAVRLDPLSPAILKDHGMTLYYARQYDGAIDCARKTLELDPGFASAYRLLSLAYHGKGNLDKALIENQHWGDTTGNQTEATIWLAYLHAASGKKAEALTVIESLGPEQLKNVNLFRGVALVYTELGEHDRAFEWLDKAYQAKAESLSSLKVDQKLDKLRSDPRFTLLLRKIGLEE